MKKEPPKSIWIRGRDNEIEYGSGLYLDKGPGIEYVRKDIADAEKELLNIAILTLQNK